MLDWVISHFSTAMKQFGEKMQDLYDLLTINPQTYRGGVIWDMVMDIFTALLGVGFTVILICGYLGIINSIETIYEAKRPEVMLSIFAMVTISGGLTAAAPQILLIIIGFCQDIVRKATGGSFVFKDTYAIPNNVIEATKDLETVQAILFWVVCFIGAIVITFTSFSILIMAYGRIFKMYIYIAISPIAVACFASKATCKIGINYIKNFLVICLEGLIIIVAFMIFSVFDNSYAANSSELSAEQETAVTAYMEKYECTREEAVEVVMMDEHLDQMMDGIANWGHQKEDEASKTVWLYVAEQCLLYLLLLSIIKGSEKETQKIFGL